jgi:DNA-binding CsgD family transcriptional regulator
MNKNISKREEEVLQLISFEMNTREIANRLFISQHTVITHRRNLLAKLRAGNVAGMIRRGFELGILN